MGERKKKKNPIERKRKTSIVLKAIRDKKLKQASTNCLQDILLELMDERGIEVKHIQKHTGISYSTLHDWVYGKVRYHFLDDKILKLARFFNVSIQYLAFGIGEDTEAFDGPNVSKTLGVSWRATLTK